jgi:hypothetical protein
MKGSKYSQHNQTRNTTAISRGRFPDLKEMVYQLYNKGVKPA